MLTSWILIHASRNGELTVGFVGGLDLVVWQGSAAVVHRGRLIRAVVVGSA